jgi:hypothetical protein
MTLSGAVPDRGDSAAHLGSLGWRLGISIVASMVERE